MEYPGFVPGPEAGIHRHRLKKRGVCAYDGTGSQRHELVLRGQQLGCQIPCGVDNDGPDENNQKGYLVQEKAPGRTIAIEFVKENTAFFGNPTCNRDKGESGQELFGVRLVYNAEYDVEGNKGEGSQLQEQHA
jgi:hypothetical protein